ncbi:MAG TPA: SRPBCC family protein [Chitinophagaceae bacterium]|nr:SRPBCC family protein [Chitinophagaceae bacterium]
MIHKLKSIQKLPIDPEKAWSFFSNAKNLLQITPPFLNLKVTSLLSDEEVYAGQMMTYKVKPILGIPLSWTTEITHVERLKLFVDEQKKGPYKLWRHEHHFKAIQGGIEMTDLVTYELPFGVLGNVAHFITAKSKLQQIFTYRYYKIIELFGDWPQSKMQMQIS